MLYIHMRKPQRKPIMRVVASLQMPLNGFAGEDLLRSHVPQRVRGPESARRGCPLAMDRVNCSARDEARAGDTAA